MQAFPDRLQPCSPAGCGIALERLHDDLGDLEPQRAPLPVELANRLDVTLPRDVEAALYYVVSESLTNVAKYAQATTATVLLHCEHGSAHVEVSDNGLGGADPARGSGLRGLIDRVEALGGRLGIESAERNGTRVWAELPLN